VFLFFVVCFCFCFCVENKHTRKKQTHISATNLPHLWRPEYARYMVEGTPGKPYGDVNNKQYRHE